MADNFLAKDFRTRQNLEDMIKVQVGIDIEKNRIAGIKITGTREELRKLGLDDLNEIFGCKAVITDLPTDTKISKEK